MLVGTADIAALSADAPTLEAFASEAVRLDEVTCLQVTAEMCNSAREAVLPPALHPTVPPLLSIQVWQVGASPWGAFNVALTRVVCRSGVRARGFTTAVAASTAQAADALRSCFGFPARTAEVSLRRNYDAVDAAVALDGRRVLAINAVDPDPLGLDDVQYTGTLNLAHTPMDLRLVQIETRHHPTRVERLTGRLLSFDAGAWGNRLLEPRRVVSASVALGAVDFMPVRFVCKVDELAFTGTESVTSGVPARARAGR